MRIRFEDPRISQEEAQAIARRISDLVTGDRGGAGVDPDEGLARHVAGEVTQALRAAGETA